MRKPEMRKIIIPIALLAALMLTTCSDRGAGERITIRFATTAISDAFEGDGVCPMSVAKVFFMREIENRTNGRITVRLFPDGQLAATAEENIVGLLNGTFDIFTMYTGGWHNVTPAFAGLNAPYLFYSLEEVWAVLDSQIGQSWKQRAYEDTGVRPVAFFDIGFRQLTNSTHPITSVNDLAGVRLRTMPDAIQVAAWEALGANVTPIPWTDLFAALEHRLVDAQENPPSNIVTARFYELQSYMTITNHNYTATIPAIGPVFWNSLSSDDQELILQVMREAQEASRQKALTADVEFMQYLRGTGIEIVELTIEQYLEFQNVARTVWPMVADLIGQDEFDQLVRFVDAMR